MYFYINASDSKSEKLSVTLKMGCQQPKLDLVKKIMIQRKLQN